ncbi:MAG: ABC transporter ATP-binding protein [Nitrospinota bacterium]
MLRVRNLSTKYGHIEAVSDVSLEVGVGELVAVLGANGAGKSTLLKTICGVLTPSGGAVEFRGEAIERLSSAERVRRGLMLVPEGRAVLTRMSVEDNLLIGAYTRRDNGVSADVREMFRRFPVLEERRNLNAGVLSGGEQQMLAIARALMARPRFLMFDEPSLGLAPKVVSEVFSLIARMRDSGITILLVEQNAQEALRLADRGYVLETGRIVVHDDADALLESEALRSAYLGGAT